VRKGRGQYDFFIVACGSDPGVDACRMLTRNVIGIGEAAIMTALAVSRRFSFLSTTPTGASNAPDRLRNLGVDLTRFASARAVGTSDEIVKKRHEKFDIYLKVGKACIQDDGAGALILSCAGMSDLKEQMEQALEVPVVVGVVSAVKIAEQFTSVPC
jgi:allantoin racemase